MLKLAIFSLTEQSQVKSTSVTIWIQIGELITMKTRALSNFCNQQMYMYIKPNAMEKTSGLFFVCLSCFVLFFNL